MAYFGYAKTRKVPRGRPLKSDDAYSLLVETVIEKAPAELGYDFAIWTIDRLRAH